MVKKQTDPRTKDKVGERPHAQPRINAPAKGRRRKKTTATDEYDDIPHAPSTPKKRANDEVPSTSKRPRTEEGPASVVRTPKLPTAFQKMLDGRNTKSTGKGSSGGLAAKLQRAKSQKMVILHHEIGQASWGPVITFYIAGSVGDVYKTTIKEFPSCNCPDFTYRRESCKHILYALVYACSVSEEVAIQRKFSEAELTQMINSSALARVDEAIALAAPSTAPSARKSLEGECAICFMEINKNGKTVWCEQQCGNNLHEACFNSWAATCSEQVTCVYCRAPWGDQINSSSSKLESILAAGLLSGQYVNVANQLGMSNVRDHSIYRTPRAPPRPEGEG